jgi:hypothetical protein
LVELLTSEDDFDEAVDNLVANWFISRRTGRAVRGTVLIHVSALHDGFVPATTTFTKQAGLRFLLDSDGPITYQSSDLAPRTDTSGVVVDYTLRVPVVAEGVGVAYEISAGPFSAIDKFNRYVLFADNDAPYVGAADTETSTELLERMPDAITVRDLNSKRAINTVLLEEFPAIDSMSIFGYGDTGMRRDLVQIIDQVELHLGGHIDIFVSTPIVERRVFEGAVGGQFTDPRSDITLFRDATIDDWRDLNVIPGDVLRITNAAASENDLYILVEVTKYYLRISPKQAFPSERPLIQRDGDFFDDATITASAVQSADANFTGLDVGRYIRISNSGSGNDGDYKITAVDVATNTATVNTTLLTPETSPPVTFEIYEDIVSYSIGDGAPSYDNKLLAQTTGEFSRLFQADGQVLLPQEPIYLIREVSILDAADPDTDPVSGRVQFPNRVNHVPQVLSGSDLQYRVDNKVPLDAQSAQHMMTLDVGYEPEYTGADGSFLAGEQFAVPSGAVFRFTAPDDVGKRIRVLDAINDDNRGEFEIASVINAGLGVTVTDPDNPGFTSVAENRLNWELSEKTKYNAQSLRVIYDTITQFDVVSAYVANENNRVACANTLLRGLHPVYVSFELTYSLKDDAAAFFDVDVAKQSLVNFINAFPSTDTLHASDIVTEFQGSNSAEVGYVELPLTITYDLLAPDGRIITYTTNDAVEVDAVRLALTAPEDRLDNPLELGVVDANVRYLSTIDLITLTEVI